MKWSFSFLPAVVLFLFQTTCPMLFGCGIYLNYVSLQFYYSQTQSEVCITLRIYFSSLVYLFIYLLCSSFTVPVLVCQSSKFSRSKIRMIYAGARTDVFCRVQLRHSASIDIIFIVIVVVVMISDSLVSLSSVATMTPLIRHCPVSL